MQKLYAALSALALAGPLAGHAQAPAPGPLYGGLGIYTSSFNYWSGNRASDLKVPVQLTAGYQLRPRLAVQASWAYNRPSFNYGTLTTAGGEPGYYVANRYEGQRVERRTTLALQLRYSLRRPAARLQLDVLGGYGLELEKLSDRYHHVATDENQQVLSETSRLVYFEQQLGVVTAGLGLRYRWGRHLEAVADGLLLGVPGHWTNPPGPAGSLGLRYRFGGPTAPHSDGH